MRVYLSKLYEVVDIGDINSCSNLWRRRYLIAFFGCKCRASHSVIVSSDSYFDRRIF